MGQDLTKIVQAIAEGTLAMVDGRKVILSKPLRAAIANARKSGLNPGQVGEDMLRAGFPVRVATAGAAYARGVKNPAKVNQYWGA